MDSLAATSCGNPKQVSVELIKSGFVVDGITRSSSALYKTDSLVVILAN